MNTSSQDTALLMTLLQRPKKKRIPNAQALKRKVDRGERLRDYDIQLLSTLTGDLKKTKPLADQYPEYQPLIAGFIDLCQEISDKALENEKRER